MQAQMVVNEKLEHMHLFRSQAGPLLFFPHFSGKRGLVLRLKEPPSSGAADKKHLEVNKVENATYLVATVDIGITINFD